MYLQGLQALQLTKLTKLKFKIPQAAYLVGVYDPYSVLQVKCTYDYKRANLLNINVYVVVGE